MGAGEENPFQTLQLFIIKWHINNKPSVSSPPQKNNCILPEDLRDFYLTTDGFTLTWNVKLDSK